MARKHMFNFAGPRSTGIFLWLWQGSGGKVLAIPIIRGHCFDFSQRFALFKWDWHVLEQLTLHDYDMLGIGPVIDT